MTVGYALARLGASGVGLTGWTRMDGAGHERAFLLVHPCTDTTSTDTMRTLAKALGLAARAPAVPVVPMDVAHATLTDGAEPAVLIDPGRELLHCPVRAGWADVARQRGEIVAAVGELVYRGRTPRDLDRYLLRTGIHAGLLRIDEWPG